MNQRLAIALVLLVAVACGRRSADADGATETDGYFSSGRLQIEILGPLEDVAEVASDTQFRIQVINGGSTPASVSTNLYNVGGLELLTDVFYQSTFGEEGSWWEASTLGDASGTILNLQPGESREFRIYAGPLAESAVAGLPKRLRINDSVSDEFNDWKMGRRKE